MTNQASHRKLEKKIDNFDMTTVKQTQFSFFYLLMLFFLILSIKIFKPESDVQDFLFFFVFCSIALTFLSPMIIELDSSALKLSWGWFGWSEKSFSFQDVASCEEFYKAYWGVAMFHFFYYSFPLFESNIRIYSLNPFYYVKLALKDGRTITLSPQNW
ncbi:MAG: hypothetical protein WCP97_01775 [bacterium]